MGSFAQKPSQVFGREWLLAGAAKKNLATRQSEFARALFEIFRYIQLRTQHNKIVIPCGLTLQNSRSAASFETTTPAGVFIRGHLGRIKFFEGLMKDNVGFATIRLARRKHLQSWFLSRLHTRDMPCSAE